MTDKIDPTEYLVTFPDPPTKHLQEPLVVPVVERITPDPNRLCSEDMHCGLGDSGCRRSDSVLAWEAEHSGEHVPAELSWGARDLYFRLDGVAYYYKPYIQYILDEINQNLQQDENDADFLAFVSSLKALVPEISPSSGPHTLDDIRAIIDSKPAGMPNFIEETENFFCFDDVGTEQVTEENITSETLTLIKDTFTSDQTLPYMDPCDSLFVKDGKVYWTDLVRWHEASSPSLRAGITLVGENYSFFPFAELDATTEQLVNIYGPKFAEEFNKTFKIVNL
jgi:hypothetical protein